MASNSSSSSASSDSGADNLAAFLDQPAVDPNLDVNAAQLADCLVTLADRDLAAEEEQRASWEWAQGAFFEDELASTSSAEPRTPSTFAEVDRVWAEFGPCLTPGSRETLKRSHAPLLRRLHKPTFERKLDGLVIGSSITVLMSRAARANGGPPGSPPSPDQEADGEAEMFPAGPHAFGMEEAAWGSLPVDLMLGLY